MQGDAEAAAEARRKEQREAQKETEAADETESEGPSVHATMDGPENPRYQPDQLQAAWVGGAEYAIWSERSGTMNAYEVNLTELSCTCEHGEHNRNTTEACGHIRKAIMCHHSNPELEHSVLMEYARNLRDANEILWKARDAHGAMRSAQEAYEAGVSNGETPGASSPTTTDDDSPAANNEAAEEAATKLKAAFDEHIEDMNVKAKSGIVWFQTGKDTPDDWPYPGFSETFKAVTSPDCVAYVHDGTADWADSPHKWHDKKPSKWFKNALEPEDVDEYIEELGL